MQRAARQLSLFDASGADESPGGYAVRESARARQLSINVFPRGRVEVVVPRRTRAADVRAFVDQHREWIEETRAYFARRYPRETFALPQTIVLPAVARHFYIRYQPRRASATVRLRKAGDEVFLQGAVADEKQCVDALKRWLKATAREAFGPQLQGLSVQTGNIYQRLQIRGQRSCWGSHSGRGTISLNYCLLFLEPELVRYLMIHELCHATHMNHSNRFWRLVRSYEPEYRRLDRALGEAWVTVPSWLGFN